MLAWDRHAETWIATHRVGWLDPVFRALTESGRAGAVWLALALALAILSRRWQPFAWVAAADGIAELTNAMLQRAVGRHRPRVHALIAVPHSHSFPSGHTSSSFACATVLCVLAPRFRVAFVALAVLIGFSRNYVGVHYPLDVLGGAVWGVLVGLLVLRLGRVRDLRLPGASRLRSLRARRGG